MDGFAPAPALSPPLLLSLSHWKSPCGWFLGGIKANRHPLPLAHPPLEHMASLRRHRRAGGRVGPAAARRGRGGEAGRPRSPAWVQAASPGLVTKGTWEDRSSFDFPKASDRCPHPKLPIQKTKQPTLTRDLGGVGGGNVWLQNPRTRVG